MEDSSSPPGELATPGEGSVSPAGRRRWGWLAALAGLATVAALYLWDDLLFAAPVVAVAGTAGPWVAFVVFSIAYSGASFVVAVWAVRVYDRWSGGTPSRLATWLEHQQHGRRGVWGHRLLASGRLVGFVLSSFLLGGILTTWVVRYTGRREGIVGVAAASSLIFGVTFAAFYAGLVGAIVRI